jgi:hypothetical protein
VAAVRVRNSSSSYCVLFSAQMNTKVSPVRSQHHVQVKRSGYRYIGDDDDDDVVNFIV